MNTVGLPERAYQAHATRGLASGHTRIRAVPEGDRAVVPLIVAAHSQGARAAQSGRMVPGRTGLQTRGRSRKCVIV
jgi:hypothetical protein